MALTDYQSILPCTQWVLKNVWLDFPGGAVDKNPPAKAGDTGSVPSLGRFHNASEQLSLCTQLLMSVCTGLCFSERSHHHGKATHHSKEQPPAAATRESLRDATKTV